MSDFIAFARIPYGYEIVDGKAQIDQVAAEKLLTYFDAYLSGSTMAKLPAKRTCSAPHPPTTACSSAKSTAARTIIRQSFLPPIKRSLFRNMRNEKVNDHAAW